jgi:hypothetical protein
MVHKNARLTPHGRLLLVRQIIEEGWRIADEVQAAGISERQSYRWLARYRRGSAAALADRSWARQHSGPATLQASHRRRSSRRH